MQQNFIKLFFRAKNNWILFNFFLFEILICTAERDLNLAAILFVLENAGGKFFDIQEKRWKNIDPINTKLHVSPPLAN
jgi:hypothetical protein